MSRTLFVMNPRAGSSRAAKVRDRLLSKHPDLHTDDWIEGRDTDHARELLRSRVADACRDQDFVSSSLRCGIAAFRPGTEIFSSNCVKLLNRIQE